MGQGEWPALPSPKDQVLDSFFFFFKDFISERRREGEREGNINMWLPLARPLLGTWPATQACALTGVESATFGSQAGAQSTEPHQPGLMGIVLNVEKCPGKLEIYSRLE